MEIELNHDLIELPNWLGYSDLSLGELGALVVFATAISQGVTPEFERHFTAPEFRTAFTKLKHRGVIEFSVEGNNVHLEIDLTSIDPTE